MYKIPHCFIITNLFISSENPFFATNYTNKHEQYFIHKITLSFPSPSLGMLNAIFMIFCVPIYFRDMSVSYENLIYFLTKQIYDVKKKYVNFNPDYFAGSGL